ncbi:NAD(P)H-binding protein [candidate division GN15 bacterium]|nr:NAD(P)H-binding protein [candidate division GN15 bacterium]
MVNQLKRRGHYVRALARSPETLKLLDNPPDDIVVGEVTRPETIRGCCRDIDLVFSSLGITKQTGPVSFYDVDYRGNLAVMNDALACGVSRFVYVSVVNGRQLRRLAIVDAHECFVDELARSEMDYTVIRPTGYFSDIDTIFDMAERGRVWLIGDGNNKSNPIHGADLAEFCADHLESSKPEVTVGGPTVHSYREIAALAFDALDKKPKISSVPVGLMKAIVGVVRLFKRHTGEVLAFVTTALTTSVTAPQTGRRTLKRHFAHRARQSRA